LPDEPANASIWPLGIYGSYREISDRQKSGGQKIKMKGEKQMAYTTQLVLRNDETENQGTRAKYGEV
jgi:hypothetical protein